MENWLNNVKDWLDRKENKNNTDKYFVYYFCNCLFCNINNDIKKLNINQNGM